MKQKLALGIGALGAIFLALSLTVFGMGASATLNPTVPSAIAAPSDDPSVAPVDVDVPTPTVAAVAPEATESTDSAATHSADPLTSDAFKALTPDEQANGREWMQTQAITATCMNDLGFEYTYEPSWEREQGVLAEPWGKTLPALRGDSG